MPCSSATPSRSFEGLLGVLSGLHGPPGGQAVQICGLQKKGLGPKLIKYALFGMLMVLMMMMAMLVMMLMLLLMIILMCVYMYVF